MESLSVGMTENPLIQVMFGPSDASLDDEQRLQFSQQMLPELRRLDEVERADRAENFSTETGMKGFETLVGFLTAEVTLPNMKEFAGWLGDRFSDQPMKVKVKVGDQKVEIEARSSKELAEVEIIANRLLASMNSDGSGKGTRA